LRRSATISFKSEIDCSVRKIVDRANSRAVQILKQNRTLFEEGSRDLLKKETMPEHDLKALFSRIQACDNAAA